MERLNEISSHLRPVGRPRPVLVGGRSPDDVVLCCAVRTPLTRAKRGGLASTPPELMLKACFSEVLRRSKITPGAIDDVCIGNVLQPGGGALSSRLGQLLGGLPTSVPISTVNRQCSSGLQAVGFIASSIRSGEIDVGVGGGVESMSMFDMMKTLQPENLSDEVFEHDTARDCLLPMGITSENVASAFNVTRSQQDEFAVSSHRKASEAQKSGKFKSEIVPVEIEVDGKRVVISEDDGIRHDASVASMGKLKPAFQKEGTTTAGNSSQVTDGASLVLLARRSAAEKMGLPILAKFVAISVVGVPPDIMGIGPLYAIPSVLGKTGLTVKDIDVFELNEAFASQACLCGSRLSIPPHKLNPCGGAIALGHPLGATGSRQIATMLPELKRRGGRYGVVSMCIGTGMGAAAVIENEQ
eukprot:GHVN01090420.1.p1 GENE.GHVN01090420.1~~GHVN01090420.1.p1  ORF type:complete len:413 (-),score=83.52 GHVN01090420.1:617-1855(-)